MRYNPDEHAMHAIVAMRERGHHLIEPCDVQAIRAAIEAGEVVATPEQLARLRTQLDEAEHIASSRETETAFIRAYERMRMGLPVTNPGVISTLRALVPGYPPDIQVMALARIAELEEYTS